MKKSLQITNLLFKSQRWSVNHNKTFNNFNYAQNFIKKDYEYCADIQAKLTDNKHLEAYNILLESYFNNITLDAQIFYLVLKKLLDNKFDHTYLQVLYKIYRCSFEPMHMMNQFMQILVNQKSCQQNLKKDFEYLHMKIPGKKRRAQKKKKSLLDQGNNHQQNSKQKQRLLREYEQNDTKNSERKKKLDLQKIIINSLKKTMGGLSNDYQIRIQDMKIQLNTVQNYATYDYDNIYESEVDKQKEINKLLLLKKISIGKIQIKEKKFNPT